MPLLTYPNQDSNRIVVNTATSMPSCRLLDIPLEIRQNIYEWMLGLHWRDHLNLICVGKQVYGEARESFFRRPLVCRSQDELIYFVRNRPPSILGSIANLQLHLKEVESEVMQPFLARVSMGIATASEQHPYLMEINRVTGALNRLPNIVQLSFLSAENATQNAPSSMITTSILSWVRQRYPGLHKLRIDFEFCQLDDLIFCKELRSLQLTGFSETTSPRIAEILSHNTALESLSIIGPPRGLQMRQRHGHNSRIVQSINYRVLDSIAPLKRLVIKEFAEPKSEGVFLTTKMLNSIYDRHRESLRTLEISSSLTPGPAFTTFLEALLMATPNIRELRLTWPGMHVAFVECVPASVQRLTLAVVSSIDAQAFIDRLQAVRYRLPCLRFVTFEVINKPCETADEWDKDGSLAFMLPIQNLGFEIRSPWTITWAIWQPAAAD